jgi:N-sulfoglucosamine sulfohydrolase
MANSGLTRREALGGVAASMFTGAASQAAPATRPNILFAIADDWGPDHAGAYGCDWVKTPSFDRVA